MSLMLITWQLDDLPTRCKSILWLHGTRFRARMDGIFGPQFRRELTKDRHVSSLFTPKTAV